ncbi:ESCRT-III [Salix suchowensis]|nr:ESCRT-III [Salix suchowensis]
MAAMKKASDALKVIHGKMTMGDVDSQMQSMAEQRELANEIGEAISNPMYGGMELDDLAVKPRDQPPDDMGKAQGGSKSNGTGTGTTRSLDQADTDTIRELKDKLNDIRTLIANEPELAGYREFDQLSQIVEQTTRKVEDIEEFRDENPGRVIREEIGSRVLVNRWILDLSDICDQLHICLFLQLDPRFCEITNPARIDYKEYTTLLTHHADYGSEYLTNAWKVGVILLRDVARNCGASVR